MMVRAAWGPYRGGVDESEWRTPGESGAVIVADDDRAIRDSLARMLEAEGYTVRAVRNGAEALEEHRRKPARLIVLDLMMPGVDGLSACRVLRSEEDLVPILVLTARAATSDRVAGLDAGADDYLAKPFDPEELLARVRALLRRASPAPQLSSPKRLVVADLEIDLDARLAWRGGRELDLTRTEFDLLGYLVANTGVVLDHGRIYEQIWGYDFGPDSKNLAVYIGYLRRKVDRDHEVSLIHTVRGVGYVVREPT